MPLTLRSIFETASRLLSFHMARRVGTERRFCKMNECGRYGCSISFVEFVWWHQNVPVRNHYKQKDVAASTGRFFQMRQELKIACGGQVRSLGLRVFYQFRRYLTCRSTVHTRVLYCWSFLSGHFVRTRRYWHMPLISSGILKGMPLFSCYCSTLYYYGNVVKTLGDVFLDRLITLLDAHHKSPQKKWQTK